MKKIISSLCLIMALFAFAACSSSNSPEKVAEKAVECISQKDFKGYVDLIYFNDDITSEQQEKAKEELAQLLTEKGERQMAKKGSVKSHEITEVKTADDGQSATVTMKITYSDNSVDNTTMKLRKDKKGNWRIDCGK